MPAPAPAFPGNNWYSASTTVTAEWPLESTTIETLVAEVEKLQAKIAAADVPGERPVVSSAAGNSASTPEATPRMVPARPVVAATPATGYSATSSTPVPAGAYPTVTPGYATPSACLVGSSCYVAAATYTPPTSARFVCVSNLSDAQRKTALAEAFSKAKTQAAELAETAGCKLAPLVSIERLVTYGRSNAAFERPSDWDPYATPVCYPSGDCGNDAVMSQPNEIEFRIKVQAQFRLE